MWRKLQPDVLRKVISVPDDSGSGTGEEEYQTDHNGKNRAAQGNSTPVAVTVVRKVTIIPSNETDHHTYHHEHHPGETKYPNYPERARRIDELARLLFPLTFLVFNLFYWSYYLGFN
ncbi:hypothetical protein WDU94_007085 [Cyamophila willieti]